MQAPKPFESRRPRSPFHVKHHAHSSTTAMSVHATALTEYRGSGEAYRRSGEAQHLVRALRSLLSPPTSPHARPSTDGALSYSPRAAVPAALSGWIPCCARRASVPSFSRPATSRIARSDTRPQTIRARAHVPLSRSERDTTAATIDMPVLLNHRPAPPDDRYQADDGTSSKVAHSKILADSDSSRHGRRRSARRSDDQAQQFWASQSTPSSTALGFT